MYFLAFLIIVVLLRIRRVRNGTKISVGRTIGYSVYYLLLGALALSGSFFLGIPFEYFIAYPILFVLAFVLAFELARRRVIFWKDADGSIYSKGGLPIYIIYVVGLIARIVIGYIYIGPNSFFTFSLPTGQVLSGAAISATIASDLLLLTGIGLLFGRNMRILRKYLAVKSGKETVEATTGNEADNPSMPA